MEASSAMLKPPPEPFGHAPTDFRLSIAASKGTTSATICEWTCRALTPDDAMAFGWDFAAMHLATDLDQAKACVAAQVDSSLAAEPVEGKAFRVPATDTVIRWIAPGDFRMGASDAGRRQHGRGAERVTRVGHARTSRAATAASGSCSGRVCCVGNPPVEMSKRRGERRPSRHQRLTVRRRRGLPRERWR